MGYGNWGAAGVLVHPAVKVGLHSDALRMTVHDNVGGTDQEIVNGKKLPLSVDSSGKSSFWIGAPVYNLGFIVTPGVNAHAFIDVGVWSDSWDFPVWFPDIAITLPPGGVDFACHSGTICRRDYAYTASSRPDISGAVVTEGLQVMGGTGTPVRPPSPIVKDALNGKLQNSVAVQPVDNGAVVSGAVQGVDNAVVAGPACPDGMVQRHATNKDTKCVSRDERLKIAAENRAAKTNWDPAGASGPRTCISGLVWREAVPNDKVCVTPERREEVARMNSGG